MFEGFDAETLGQKVSDRLTATVADLTGKMDPLMTAEVVAASYSTVSSVICEMAQEAGAKAVNLGADRDQVATKVAFIVTLITLLNEGASLTATEYLHG